VSLVDDESQLEPPQRSSWQFPDRDIRIDWSALTLIDQEGPSCRHLFGGEELLPFAALYRGPLDPDEMSLTDGDCDLVCFFYEPKGQRPQVVVWHDHEAQQEYMRWEAALKASGWQEDEPVRFADFTVRVAPNFDAFLNSLRSGPESVAS
jgi:hypothetical protein